MFSPPSLPAISPISAYTAAGSIAITFIRAGSVSETIILRTNYTLGEFPSIFLETASALTFASNTQRGSKEAFDLIMGYWKLVAEDFPSCPAQYIYNHGNYYCDDRSFLWEPR